VLIISRCAAWSRALDGAQLHAEQARRLGLGQAEPGKRGAELVGIHGNNPSTRAYPQKIR
jgi:hypothetical protein